MALKVRRDVLELLDTSLCAYPPWNCAPDAAYVHIHVYRRDIGVIA
jgi:hypothetical protein